MHNSPPGKRSTLSFHAQNRQMSNGSSINEFVLLAFTDTRELQLLTFWLFLGIYLAALLGNSLIIAAVACDHRLHTPMYFFLLNLSLLDLGSISTTLPKAMANSLWGNRAISYSGCAAQVFFFVFLIGGEYCLLTVMAYNRYIAICKPLHYGTLLGSRACVHMAAAAWGSGFLNSLLHTGNTFSLPLCQGKVLDQFFCEVPEILKVSCSDSGYLREVGLIVVSACLIFVCFVFIVVSYVQIIRTVLRIPSDTGIFASLKPPSISCPSLDVVVSFLYSVVPPAVNPLIYSMRNQELKNALWKLAQGTLAISYLGCAAQVFFFVFLVGGEYCLLTVMAYDRYVATCKPLHYGTLLGSRAYDHIAAAVWGCAVLYAVLHTANTFFIPCCKGNALDQFFCEIPQILKLSCSDAYLREVGLIVVSACLVFGCFVFIVLSYVQIFRAVLRIPSKQGRHKAFSTCLRHMAVVSLFVSTAAFAQLKPPSVSSPSLDLVVSFLYSVVPPAVNPLIYSMRNQELKDALWKLVQGMVSSCMTGLMAYSRLSGNAFGKVRRGDDGDSPRALGWELMETHKVKHP
ncbi:hypothetical protein QYF61_020459 [Mycteria americana]|uniref:G-protein coupled receptors family 1 profile domain-containing protein n=1 Tax=Mycteria americana TaxID=33587 RepID=A0AAN7NA87_MYCAM|nr:hypothetical protein QYF61_020459 [Mycteria americana]